MDSDTFDKLLPEIDRAADKLDDMYVYAAAQDVMDKLNNLARKSLSQSVSVFPEIAVELSLPSSRTGSDSAKAGIAPSWAVNRSGFRQTKLRRAMVAKKQ